MKTPRAGRERKLEETGEGDRRQGEAEYMKRRETRKTRHWETRKTETSKRHWGTLQGETGNKERQKTRKNRARRDRKQQEAGQGEAGDNEKQGKERQKTRRDERQGWIGQGETGNKEAGDEKTQETRRDRRKGEKGLQKRVAAVYLSFKRWVRNPVQWIPIFSKSTLSLHVRMWRGPLTWVSVGGGQLLPAGGDEAGGQAPLGHPVVLDHVLHHNPHRLSHHGHHALWGRGVNMTSCTWVMGQGSGTCPRRRVRCSMWFVFSHRLCSLD
jgi:hypothetical protein